MTDNAEGLFGGASRVKLYLDPATQPAPAVPVEEEAPQLVPPPPPGPALEPAAPVAPAVLISAPSWGGDTPAAATAAATPPAPRRPVVIYPPGDPRGESSASVALAPAAPAAGPVRAGEADAKAGLVEWLSAQPVASADASLVDAPADFDLAAARTGLLEARVEEPETATWGMRGALRRTGFNIRPSAAETNHRADQKRIRTFSWPESFNIVVANKKGGVAKTPTALLLAGVLASVRGGGVCVFEATDAAGALARRGEGDPQRGLYDLLYNLERVHTAAELDAFMQMQESHAAVLGSPRERGLLGGESVTALRRVIGQFYRMTVADTGNNPFSSTFAAAIDGAHALVLPTILTTDSVVELVDTLAVVNARSENGRHLARHAVIIVSDNGRAGADAVTLRRLLDGLGAHAVIDVPYDQHIAAGTRLSLSGLSKESTVAWTRAAAAVLTAATTPRGTL